MMKRRTLPGQFPLALPDELIVDLFAGGGGASLGIEWGIGRPVDIAVNHDPEAVAMHQANHPHTTHYCESVFKVDPVSVTRNQPVGLLWASPDCKHFSKAKGKKPVSKKIRGLAWVVIRWAKRVRPRVIMLENVEEFQDWGPVLPDGTPCPVRKGQTFKHFVQQLERQGYKVEYRELRACDYGAPTIRKRLFLIARRDGLPIVWPKPTHGPGRTPYRTAAECIDFSIYCPSIFERTRPLAEATQRRIAKGLQRFVLEAAEPFIVTCNHGGDHFRGHGIESKANTAVVAAFLAKHYGDQGQRPGSAMQEPVSTVTARDHHGLVTSHLIKLRGTCKDGQDVRQPAPTVTAGGMHIGEVRAFLVKYYGTAVGQDLREPMHTVTAKHRMGLVTIKGEEYQIVDIGMRMLEPRELYRAQGFPDSYIIDPVVNGKPLSKAAQVRMCGNSVPPYFSMSLVRANFVHEQMYREQAA